MGTWSISPSGQGYATINQNGIITFYRNNEGHDREFTVTYIDDTLNETSETIMQMGEC